MSSHERSLPFLICCTNIQWGWVSWLGRESETWVGSKSSQRKSRGEDAAVLGDTTQIRFPKLRSALNPGVQEPHGAKTTPNLSPHSSHQGHPPTWDHRLLFPHAKNYFLGPRNLKGKDRSAEQEDVCLSKCLVISPPPWGKRRLLASRQL